MKLLLFIPLLVLEGILHTTELNKNIFAYSADYTSANLNKIVKNINIDEHNYYQKVILDQDNVYRLKTFKRVLSTTPKILKNMINLEANLVIENRTEYASKKRNIINSL
tara:strand:+ start:233 stop:559 length:327 start_codon:yes stop_codon:yes gene_type:complete